MWTPRSADRRRAEPDCHRTHRGLLPDRLPRRQHPSGGLATATAEPTALDEAVVRGTYDGGIDLVPVPRAAFTAAAVAGSVTAPCTPQVDGIDGDPGGGVSAAARVSGSLTLSAGLDLRAR